MNQSENKWYLINQVKNGKGGLSVVFKASFDSETVRYGKRDYKVKVIDRRNTNKFRKIFGMRHWDVAIEIGILDPNKDHLSFLGDSVSYEDLFAYLKHDGYDPLLPLRDPEFQKQVSRVMGLKILQANRKINGGSHKSIRGLLIPYAMDLRDYCRDYIRGGIPPGKPALSEETIRYRDYKNDINSAWYSYKYGMDEALWESGQLEQAIEFDVYVDETQRELMSRRDKFALASYKKKRAEGRKKENKGDSLKAAPVLEGETKSWAGAEIRKSNTSQEDKKKLEKVKRISKVIATSHKKAISFGKRSAETRNPLMTDDNFTILTEEDIW